MQSGGGGKKGRNGNSGKFYASFLQLHLPLIHFLTPTFPATATNLTGGMGGNGGGGGGGGRGKDNVFKHFKDIFVDDKYFDGDDSEGGNDDEAYYLLEE
jgi:hypothetical protein